MTWTHKEMINKLSRLSGNYGFNLRSTTKFQLMDVQYDPDVVWEIADKIVIFEIETNPNIGRKVVSGEITLSNSVSIHQNKQIDLIIVVPYKQNWDVVNSRWNLYRTDHPDRTKNMKVKSLVVTSLDELDGLLKIALT